MPMQFIYTMKGLGKVHQPDHVVLKDIWLSFLPGAKIGVLGLNGAGKSTLLRIMAGEDHELRRRGIPGRGHQRRLSAPGAAPRSRQDRARQRRGRRRRDPRAADALRRDQREVRRGSVARRDGQGPRGAGQASRIGSRRPTAGTSTRGSSWRWTRCGCRRRTPTSRRSRAASAAASRSAGCCCESPDLLLLDEPTNHLDAESVAWLERFLKDYPGTVVAVTHDRYFLDNVAGWILELDRGSGIPWEGNYSSWLEQKQQRLEVEEKQETKRQRTLQRELDWIRMSPRARQAKGKARLNAYEDLLKEETAQKIEQVEIYIPPGPRLGDIVVEARGLRKGYGDLLLMDDVTFTLPARRHRRRHRPERRRQDDAVPDDHGPGAARRRHAPARRDRQARLRRSVARCAGRRQDRLGGDHRRRRRGGARQADGRVARVRLVVQLQGPRSAAQGRLAVGRRAQPRAPRQAAQGRRATCCCSTSRPTISTSTRCARSKRRCWRSPAAPSSSATIAGSSIASPRTCSRSKATARWSGSRATTRTTKPTESAGSAPRRTSRTGSSIGS